MDRWTVYPKLSARIRYRVHATSRDIEDILPYEIGRRYKRFSRATQPLPCPWCGHTPKVWLDGREYMMIQCINKACKPDHSIERWNARALVAQ